jgi:ABC-type polar amino acid transport system ATPase subunit
MSGALSVTGLRLRRGSRDILSDVSFDAAPGAIVALMGLSGSGKTTVLRAIAGLEAVDGGAIRFGDAGGRAGMVFQFHHLFEHLTALENVCLAPVHVHKRTRLDAQQTARQLLEDLGVGARAGALPRELSGGEAQRVAIARALATDPLVLLLDEPTASLDPARRHELGLTLQRLAATGRALVVTCHDVAFVREFASTCLILAEGCIVERGEPATLLESPAHDATRALLRSKQ